MMLKFDTNPLVLQTHSVWEMTDEQFFQFCQLNDSYCIERSAKGELIIMSPKGSETGHHNAKLTQQLGIWSDENGTGIDFDSSTGFKLPNGAYRSPDATWISLEKWNAIAPEKRTKFAPVCPDFVVELRSPSDNLQPLKDKMIEYIENGTSLGWLIDRKQQQVYIYRPNQEVECLTSPESISGGSVLPGFVLNLAKIW
ncbi:MAG: Uma2 family endonuclease [Jaaginema sp. PMC 1079.18]|nr:Uma2 family endonuclease [Jaaginema sp. PMC 1080.18]MEC4849938.1 Uma2 family endonuclease [Jaaginema sp. PMC 1079.18]MEC4865165.1 Uma2 family endonuclease [Jaaginema sp. PMC 1078.18]